jgi:hypothetical protein
MYRNLRPKKKKKNAHLQGGTFYRVPYRSLSYPAVTRSPYRSTLVVTGFRARRGVRVRLPSCAPPAPAHRAVILCTMAVGATRTNHDPQTTFDSSAASQRRWRLGSHINQSIAPKGTHMRHSTSCCTVPRMLVCSTSRGLPHRGACQPGEVCAAYADAPSHGPSASPEERGRAPTQQCAHPSSASAL